MRKWQKVTGPLLVSWMVALLGCGGVESTEAALGEATGAIVNGTPVQPANNSFVRFPLAGCSGSLFTNEWALFTDNCPVHVGDQVLMDNQATTVKRIVRMGPYFCANHVALAELASPLRVGGQWNYRRKVRTTEVPAMTTLRCFGYGLNVDAPGVGSVLRGGLMRVAPEGGSQNDPRVYTLFPPLATQHVTLGDLGAACLDSAGDFVTDIGTYWTSSPHGEADGVKSSYMFEWVNRVLAGQCTTDEDCLTGICNMNTHQCVASHCHDGRQDSDEAGVDCGGSCHPCVHHTGPDDCGSAPHCP